MWGPFQAAEPAIEWVTLKSCSTQVCFLFCDFVLVSEMIFGDGVYHVFRDVMGEFFATLKNVSLINFFPELFVSLDWNSLNFSICLLQRLLESKYDAYILIICFIFINWEGINYKLIKICGSLHFFNKPCYSINHVNKSMWVDVFHLLPAEVKGCEDRQSCSLCRLSPNKWQGTVCMKHMCLKQHSNRRQTIFCRHMKETVWRDLSFLSKIICELSGQNIKCTMFQK